ncbi:MAG: crotonase/enoyl-CoA hydratase family protein [Anaerolineae bacterium]|nr:crotonase/enoyl-CoA hydratase family protein [Anaerolineae bacterium]
MESFVSYEFSEGVATIALNDGKVNALGFAMQDAINAALDKAEADEAVVVLTGNAKAFSAGFDLAVVKAGGQNVPKMMDGGCKIGQRLLAFPRPVVLAVNNHAMAMGAILLMCADLRIGSDAGIKVQLNETALGMVLPQFVIGAAVHWCRPKGLTRKRRLPPASSTKSPPPPICSPTPKSVPRVWRRCTEPRFSPPAAA